MNIKSDFLEGIGNKIVEYRERNNQTQNDISFLTGIENSEISKYEKGKNQYDYKYLIKILPGFKCAPKAIM